MYPGDTIAVTLGLNQPIGDDRGSPWVKTEVTSTTTIRKGETHKAARLRLLADAEHRLDTSFARLLKEVRRANRA